MGAGGEVGRSAGVGKGMGGKGNVKGSFESLSEEEDSRKCAPVLEGVAVIVVVGFMMEGAVNVLE
jgi:hypothetical protein